MRKILVVGGAGYVGGYLTDRLARAGNQVVVYDSLVYESRYFKPVDLVVGDIRDYSRLARILPNFDVVVWLAALVGDGACAIDPFLTRSINTEPVVWLADKFRGKIVFPSSCSIYGAQEELIAEDGPVGPLSEYGWSKLAAEQYLTEHRPDALVFRLGTLFGIGDTYSRVRFDLVLNVMARTAATGKPVRVFGGEQWRPLLHVRDVAETVKWALSEKLNGVFNLATVNVRMSDLAQTIVMHVPGGRVEHEDMPFEDQRNYRVNTDKIRALGWTPQYSLLDGIREIVGAIRDRRIKDLEEPTYSNVEFLNKLRLGGLT